MATYTYDPSDIESQGVSRMRFELGDTAVSGEGKTSYLTDEEIKAALGYYPKSWKKAKLFLLQGLYRRFSYEVDTTTGPLKFSLNQRAERFKQAYDELKKEVDIESMVVPGSQQGNHKPPYFYAGMQENRRAGVPHD